MKTIKLDNKELTQLIELIESYTEDMYNCLEYPEETSTLDGILQKLKGEKSK